MMKIIFWTFVSLLIILIILSWSTPSRSEDELTYKNTTPYKHREVRSGRQNHIYKGERSKRFKVEQGSERNSRLTTTIDDDGNVTFRRRMGNTRVDIGH